MCHVCTSHFNSKISTIITIYFFIFYYLFYSFCGEYETPKKTDWRVDWGIHRTSLRISFSGQSWSENSDDFLYTETCKCFKRISKTGTGTCSIFWRYVLIFSLCCYDFFLWLLRLLLVLWWSRLLLLLLWW